MNIKNQIRLSVLISLVLVVVIAASIFVSYQNMQDLRDQEALAADVVRGGYELTYLSNDYLINAEPRARLQWEERYASLQPIIGQLKPENKEEAQSLAIIRDYNEKNGVLFREIPEPGALSNGAVLFPSSYQQVTWSRINIQSQGMIYEAWRLRHLYNDDVSEARFWNNILVVVLMVFMLIIIGFNYLLISRRLVRSIREVDTGSRAFAAGNLDYRIPLQRTDEIGNIGAGLNIMAANLKTITASRDELDREVNQRRHAEEALQSKNTDLEAAYIKITANEEELKANFDELVDSQQALADSERKYRNLYLFAQVGLFETSFRDATIVACNQRYANLAGFESVEEAIGKDILHLYVNPEDRAEVGRVLREKGFIENHTLKLRNHSTGKIFWAQFSARFNFEREVAEGSIIDITLQKEMEAGLRASEERFRLIFENSPLGVVLVTPDFRFFSVNPAWISMTGYTNEELLTMSFRDITHPDYLAGDMEHMRYLIAGKIPVYSTEKQYIRKDGSLLWGLVRVTTIRNSEGTLLYFAAQIADITERKQAEEALKASEEKFSTAFKTSPYAITITRIKDGSFIEVNDAFTPITGFTHEEALSGSSIGFGLWVNTEDRNRVIATLLDGRTVNGEEFLFRKKNGELITGLFSARIISINNEPCILSSINDISDRMRAEEDLHKSELRFRTMTDWTYDWEYWINPERDALYVSPSVERITGYSPDEFAVDKGLMERIILPDDYALWEKHVLLHADADQHGNHAQIEFRIIRKDGTIRWIGHVCRSIYTEDGTWAGTRVSNRDITERKAVEDALRQSEEKYRVLFTRMIEGSALHDMVYDPSGNPVDYRIIDVNPAFESTLGIKREDIIGKTTREAYGVDAPPYFDIYARVATTGQPEWFEVYFAPMKKHFAISAYSTRKGRFATIFEDITGRKEAEELREHLIQELEQKNAELERFTYTVSHDLKSPLITIKGFAGLIEDDAQKGDPVQLKKDVNRITSAADTMQELLADVLELSRIGRVVSPPEKISFSTIAHEAVELLAGPLAERGVTVSIASDFPFVNVDHARIREVIVNLIENAVKFLGAQKEPVIRIGVEMQGTIPVFFVQDNGIGIDPRYLERIFNLFERLDVSTHGTGIGLTIVRRIIEVHGGKIWAESEGAGKGTTFKFTLPGVTEGEVRP